MTRRQGRRARRLRPPSRARDPRRRQQGWSALGAAAAALRLAAGQPPRQRRRTQEDAMPPLMPLVASLAATQARGQRPRTRVALRRSTFASHLSASMAARLNVGSNMLLRNFRTKLRKPILESLKLEWAPVQYQDFATWLNKDKRLLQIEEDNAPFAEANYRSWTLDGIT